MDDLEFYRLIHEIEADVKRIHQAIIETLTQSLPVDKPLDYQGSVVLSVTHLFNRSIETVLGQMGVSEARFVDADLVKKAEEIIRLEKDFYESGPTGDV